MPNFSLLIITDVWFVCVYVCVCVCVWGGGGGGGGLLKWRQQRERFEIYMYSWYWIARVQLHNAASPDTGDSIVLRMTKT